MSTLTIGKLASAAGVGVDTVRFYERAILLNKPPRTASGYRLYDMADAARVRFIRRAEALGFSLEEIVEPLKLDDGGRRRSAVRALAERRLIEIEHKLVDFKRMRDAAPGDAAKSGETRRTADRGGRMSVMEENG